MNINLTSDQVHQIWLDAGMKELTPQELATITNTINTLGQLNMDDMNREQWIHCIADGIKDEAKESFTPHYMMLVQYKGSIEISVMHTKTDGVWRNCVAEESNKHLLIEIGDRLIDENLIDSYQLVKTAGKPVIAL